MEQVNYWDLYVNISDGGFLRSLGTDLDADVLERLLLYRTPDNPTIIKDWQLEGVVTGGITPYRAMLAINSLKIRRVLLDVDFSIPEHDWHHISGGIGDDIARYFMSEDNNNTHEDNKRSKDMFFNIEYPVMYFISEEREKMGYDKIKPLDTLYSAIEDNELRKELSETSCGVVVLEMLHYLQGMFDQPLTGFKHEVIGNGEAGREERQATGNFVAYPSGSGGLDIRYVKEGNSQEIQPQQQHSIRMEQITGMEESGRGPGATEAEVQGYDAEKGSFNQY